MLVKKYSVVFTVRMTEGQKALMLQAKTPAEGLGEYVRWCLGRGAMERLHPDKPRVRRKETP